MDALMNRPTHGATAWRRLASIGGAFTTLIASAFAVVLALAFTAALAVVAMIGVALVGFTAAAVRARRSPVDDPNLIEARPMGGHSWVAYGWDQDGRKA